MLHTLLWFGLSFVCENPAQIVHVQRIFDGEKVLNLTDAEFF